MTEIAITFTWRGMWRTLIELYINGDAEGSREALIELNKMALGADRWSAIVKLAAERSDSALSLAVYEVAEQLP